MEHNTIVNRYLSDNERYADLINGCEFGGEQIIAAEDLQDMDTQVNATPGERTRNKKTDKRKTKQRDLLRKLAFGVNFMVIGIENQEEVHYLMPLRTMEYDVGEYWRQVGRIRRQNRQNDTGNRKQSSGEFLSGFTKEDRLHPCVTLVLYYGEEWDGSRNLNELLDFTDIPKPLQNLVNDYKIHLIEVKKLQDTSVFKTDLKQVFDFIRYSEDKKKLKELVEQDVAYQCLDEDAYDMMALYAKSTKLLNMKNEKKEGGGFSVCRAIQEMLQDEREEGRNEGMEEGRNEGRAEERIDAVQRMLRKGYTKEVIFELDYTEEEYEKAELELCQMV